MGLFRGDCKGIAVTSVFLRGVRFLQEYKEPDVIRKVNLLTEDFFNLLLSADNEDIITGMMRLIASRLSARATYLMLFSEERKGLELEAFHGIERGAFKVDFLPLGEGVEGRVARERAPLQIDDIQEDERAFALLLKTGSCGTLRAHPLFFESQLLGVITILTDPSKPLTRESEQLLPLIVSKCAPVLRKSLAARETQACSRDYAIIKRVTEAGSAAKSREEMVKILEMQLPGLLGASECVVELRDAVRKKRRCRFHRMEECPAYLSGDPLFSPDLPVCKIKDNLDSCLCIPLKVPEEIMGVIHLDNPSPYLLKPAARDFIDILGRHISGSLYRFLSMGRYEKKLGALSALYDVAHIMSTTANLQEALEYILKIVSKLVNAERAQLMLLNEKEDEIYVRASWSSDGKSFGATKMKVGEGVAGWVIQHGRHYFAKNTEKDALFIPSPEGQHEFRSILCIPIMEKNRKIGVINIGTLTREREFTHDEIQTLTVIASRAALTIENARLVERVTESIHQLEQKNMLLESGREELQRKGKELVDANGHLKDSLKQLQTANRQLSTLYEITRTLASTLELSDILDITLQKVMKIVSSPLGAVSISLHNEDRDVFEIAASKGIKRTQDRAFEIPFLDIPKKLARSLFLKKKPAFLEGEEALFVSKSLGMDPKVKAIYIWPLVVKTTTIGVLTVTCGTSKGLRDDEKNILFAITQQVSIAIENSRLYQETRKRAHVLSSIHKIITAIISDNPEKLNTMAKLASELMSQECCAVVLIEGGKHFNLEAAYGLGEDFRYGWYNNALDGITEEVQKSGKFIRTGSPENRLVENRFLEDKGIESLIVAPLKVQEKLIGMLLLGNSKPYDFSIEEMNHLIFLADQVALGIENARLYKNALYEKNKTEAILKSIGDGVVTLDWERKITSFNPAASDISGWKAEEVVGRSCQEVFHGKDKDGQAQCSTHCPINEIIGKIIDNKEPSKVIKNKGSIITKDGRERYIEDTHSIVFIGDELEGAVIVFRDVTEERLLQQMKSDFIASVAHDLKTPLAAIKGYAMTLIKHGGKFDKDTQREFFMIINSEIDRLTRLLENLLNLTKMEVGKLITRPEDFNILILAKKVKDLYQINTSKHEIIIESETNLPYAYADIDQVEQILNNLVSNAIKYSPNGGRVSICFSLAGRFIRVCARDEGIGIPEHELNNIFERYHRVESSSTRRISGTGLGLFITKMLVEAQDGKVWVESTPGEGSQFYFELPLSRSRL
jgi:PAS domain S-box-containing protein